MISKPHPRWSFANWRGSEQPAQFLPRMPRISDAVDDERNGDFPSCVYAVDSIPIERVPC